MECAIYFNLNTTHRLRERYLRCVISSEWYMPSTDTVRKSQTKKELLYIKRCSTCSKWRFIAKLSSSGKRAVKRTTCIQIRTCLYIYIGDDWVGDVWVKSFHVLFKYPTDIHFRISYFHSNHKIQPLAMGMLAHVDTQQSCIQCTKCRHRFSFSLHLPNRMYEWIHVHFSPCHFMAKQNKSDLRPNNEATAAYVVSIIRVVTNKCVTNNNLLFTWERKISGRITTPSKECHRKCHTTKWQEQMFHKKK